MPQRGATFRVVGAKTGGFSPGWDLLDASGQEWSAKAGPEAQSEVVASRPPTYHLAEWVLEGATDTPEPSRFRPKLPTMRRVGDWSWHRSPFVGTPELNGLLVLMRRVNNWDLLERNNAPYEVDEGSGTAHRYVVQDLGAALGRAKVLGSTSRNDVDDFETTAFTKGGDEDNGHVRFDDIGRWHRELFRNIPPSHARWVCSKLDRLTDGQWLDAFRAGGYDGPTADRFIRRLRAKVAEGMALPAVP